MSEQFDLETRRAIKAAVARDAYRRRVVRIADPDLTGFGWLVASHRGAFAVSLEQTKLAIRGWFFGIHRHGDAIYMFENCGMRDRASNLGRVIHIGLEGKQLTDAKVLITGLDANCHQLAVIDGALCVVDTANQAIKRFALSGEPIDVKRPFPDAPASDRTGAYLHINSIAKVGSRIAIVLHNGKAEPQRNSELAWLDQDWRVLSREPIAGHNCHDVLEDEAGVLWHSGSLAGELLASDGRVVKITDTLMTRGITITPDHMLVGVTSFGPRQVRDYLNGGVVILDRGLNVLVRHDLDGAPTDSIAL